MMGRGSGGISIPLVLLCLGLTALAYYLAEKPLLIPPPSAIGATAQDLPKLPRYEAYKAPVLSDLTEAASRPLFAETRQPPDNAIAVRLVEPEAKANASPLNHTLIGIFTMETVKLALLHPNDKGPNVRVGVGDIVNGWRVTSITPEQVEFEHDGETQTLMPKAPVPKKRKRAPRRKPRRKGQNSVN